MARSRLITQLPLDTWANLMGVNPFEFNQVGLGFPAQAVATCPWVWFQSPWMQSYLSRDAVAEAIVAAESLLANQLHFWPAPKYFTSEGHPYPRPHNRDLYGWAGTPRGQWKSVRLNWGKVQGGGLLARNAMSLAAPVVLSDTDGDGVTETFTTTVLTTVPADEIAVYFTSADRNAVPIDESWRIRPVQVVSAAGVATITGNLWQLVKPDLTMVTNPAILDVTVAANFATMLDVYQTYRDTTYTLANPAQGSVSWEGNDCANPPCQMAWLPICLGARNPEIGLVWLDFWLAGANCTPVPWEPDRVSLNYQAGEPLVNGQMNPDYADIVAHLATALLPMVDCGCESGILKYWHDIEAVASGGIVQDQDNPFGPQRGAVYAWKRIQELRQAWVAVV